MRNDRLLALLAVIVGIVLIAIAIIFWVEPAKSLPSILPGHEAGYGHRHAKHGMRVPAGLGVLSSPGSAPGQPHDGVVKSSALISIPGDRHRAPAGIRRALPDLEPRAQRHRPELLGWNIHRTNSTSCVSRCDPPRHGDRLLGFLLARLGSDHEGPAGRSATARSTRTTRRRARLAARDRHDPGRHARAVLEHKLRRVFASPSRPRSSSLSTACFSLRPSACAAARPGDRTTTRGSRARRRRPVPFGVGAAQALALIPGFSRSGATMGGGLLVGLSNRTRRASRSCSRRRSSAPPPC